MDQYVTDSEFSKTVKWRLKTNPTSTFDRFDLTPADIAQHRITKVPGVGH
jgi:hypothetical protein